MRKGFRKGAVALGALLLAASLALLGAPPPARAATPDLTLVVAATYDVQPDAGKVAVTARITATNHLHDTATKRFFFSTADLAVLPGTSGFKVSTPGATATVSVAARTSTYTLLKLGFGANLGAGTSIVLTLTFDIKDPGGAPDRSTRISPSIVSFTAWAFATSATPGSTVSVRFPAGYSVTIGRGPLSGPTTDSQGHQVWSSGPLSTPLTFIADVTADRPGDYAVEPLSAVVGGKTAEISIRSWPDDTAWRDRVGGLLVRGLPALGAAIGVPWPIDVPLTVDESLVRTTGGYAGLFDPAQHRILISYIAPPGVALHEAAHAWFNGALVADRWAAEAFASYYAAQAAQSLKLTIASPVLTDALRQSAYPLNAWGPTGASPDTNDAYGYAASLAFAQAVGERAGPAALQVVWTRAADGIGAYQPASGSEPAAGPPDWRSLLDLVDDATGLSFDDLWRRWIARPEDTALLDARATARAAYEQLVRDAGPWTLPRSIRDAMRAWQFDVAMTEITGAQAVLAQRAQLEAAAARAGASMPPTLEVDFEGDQGLPAAAAEATAELTTLEAIREAAAAEPLAATGDRTLLVDVGLLGVDPGRRLADARAAFAASELDTAIAAASDAAAAWTSASDIGRGRLVSAGLLALAGLLFGRMAFLRWRRRPRAATKVRGRA
jgi:hypothetical protein